MRLESPATVVKTSACSRRIYSADAEVDGGLPGSSAQRSSTGSDLAESCVRIQPPKGFAPEVAVDPAQVHQLASMPVTKRVVSSSSSISREAAMALSLSAISRTAAALPARYSIRSRSR